MPDARRGRARDQQPVARRLSKRYPKNGWTNDEATVAASMMAAVRV